VHDSWQQHQRVGVALTLAFGLLGSLVAYYAVRGNVPPTEPPPLAVTPLVTTGPVVSVTMPHADPELPPGPYREKVQVTCTVCHSTQLILNQPPFPKKKWLESVHKMVTTYGAPIRPEEGKSLTQQESEIVEYLTTIRGKD
jgi:hypothetical protein